jgi:hypothetical protein
MDASINGRNEEGVIRRLGVKQVEHVDSVHVVGAYQQSVKFRGEVTCPEVGCMMYCGADS